MAELTVRMPALSATMEDAELVSWLVQVGDEVRTGTPLAEVGTDKVEMELECPYDGTVSQLLAEPGQRVDLGAPVAILSSEEDDLLGDLDLEPSDRDGASEPEDGSVSDTAPSGETTSGLPPVRTAIAPAPPPVRKRARQLGVNLDEVTPTGSRGHVTHADLTRHINEAATESRPAPAPAPEPSVPAAAAPTPTPPATAAAPARPLRDRDGGDRVSTGRRRAIRLATAKVTTRSAAVPQFTLHRRVDVGLARERRAGRSLTTEIARALAAALWRHPECNAVWDEEREDVVPLPGVRIGIAVDTPDGLVVVGVDDPDAVDPSEADRRIKAAIDRARSGRLTADDQRDLSSTISNLGGLGIDRFDALLLPPQATILSVGRMTDTPVASDGRVRVASMIDFGLTVDHRVADGADGARMLETFARRLEV